MDTNRRIVLAERPRYIFPTANCFKLKTGPIPEPGEGEILLRTLWLSMDPYLLGKVKRASNQAEPIPLGEVMVGPTVARVEKSNHPDYQPGDLVSGFWGWQDYAISDGVRIHKLPAGLKHPAHALTVLGYSGFGAYVALLDLGAAKPGDTVVIGAATGGMGQIVGQIAKLKGIRAIGVAGGAEKCQMAVEQFGFAACLDRRAKNLPEQMRGATPNGVDVYIETVGGKVFDSVLPRLNLHARVIVCGLMEMYSAASLPSGVDRSMLLLNEILIRRLEVKGLSVFDHMRRLFPTYRKEMIDWINNGQIKPVEDVIEGLEKAPEALQGVFEGRNRGKSLVHVAD